VEHATSDSHAERGVNIEIEGRDGERDTGLSPGPLKHGLFITGYSHSPTDDLDGGLGFRVAFVPEPATLSLLLFGGIVALKRRR